MALRGTKGYCAVVVAAPGTFLSVSPAAIEEGNDLSTGASTRSSSGPTRPGSEGPLGRFAAVVPSSVNSCA